MNKIYFNNDYSEIACPEIIENISKYSKGHYIGYGGDEICESAREKIKKYLGDTDCDIHFLVGGTQANTVMIDAMLKPWEAVASVVSGHINVHEAGSIESVGHRIEPLPEHNGKMDPDELEKLCIVHEFEHMTDIKGVYISQATETGTVYSRRELLALREVCDKHNLYMFVDGARMGSALMSEGMDLTLKDMAEIADCFYIGATKNGGMIGEAMVITNDELKPNYRRLMKQHGALLAKGFILGIQFDTLFTDDLFFRLARHENDMAMYLKAGMKKLGVKFRFDSVTNQQFPVFENDIVEKLAERYQFEIWEPGEKETTIRFVCSWATVKEDIDSLLKDIEAITA